MALGLGQHSIGAWQQAARKEDVNVFIRCVAPEAQHLLRVDVGDGGMHLVVVVWGLSAMHMYRGNLYGRKHCS